jgi:hypothetical protein
MTKNMTVYTGEGNVGDRAKPGRNIDGENVGRKHSREMFVAQPALPELTVRTVIYHCWLRHHFDPTDDSPKIT